jgi:hypothetical protein
MKSESSALRLVLYLVLFGTGPRVLYCSKQVIGSDIVSHKVTFDAALSHQLEMTYVDQKRLPPSQSTTRR